jgi:hypothetical protein
MPRTSCRRCEGEGLEVQQLKPQGHDSTGLIVQCAKCGAPVTFLDANVKDTRPDQLEEVLEEIKRTVVDITDRFADLAQRLGGRVRRQTP